MIEGSAERGGCEIFFVSCSWMDIKGMKERRREELRSMSLSNMKHTVHLFLVFSLLSPYLLSDYFSQHLGEYLNVLSALEKLNVAILKAMDKTKEVRTLKTLKPRHVYINK